MWSLFFHVLFSHDFPFRLPLDYLPSSLLCADHLNPEILGNPSLHCPCPWQHQCWGFLQSQRSKLCNPGPEVCFEHRYFSRFFLIYAICPFSVDHRYDFKYETVFQVYWAIWNCLIVAMLTALVKLPDLVLEWFRYNGSSLLDVKNYLGLENLIIMKKNENGHEVFFIAIICTIFATCFLSLLAHFCLKRFSKRREPRKANESIELNDLS